MVLTNIYQYLVIALSGLLVALGIAYWIQRGALDDKAKDLTIEKANNKILEIQRDALSNALATQSDAISKIAVLEEYNHKVYSERSIELSRSLDKERLRVRDLNGTQDCLEASRVIGRIIDANHTI